jgi:ABC-type transport system involved in multi-copper enzyme maturation permease subunit
MLYKPDLERSHFFVPGLVGIILQLVTLFLTLFAVVRERELGTLEQLFVTPVSRTGLRLGKLLPYAMVGFCELLIVMVVMIYVFGVSINGSDDTTGGGAACLRDHVAQRIVFGLCVPAKRNAAADVSADVRHPGHLFH